MPAPIMVVDDDRDIREIVSDVLSHAGYEVVTAANGADALVLLQTMTPCLILLDLNMPIMDGMEFRRRQQSDPMLVRIPTVIMSAMHRMNDRIAALGVEEALPKPVELRRLLELVRRYATDAETAHSTLMPASSASAPRVVRAASSPRRKSASE